MRPHSLLAIALIAGTLQATLAQTVSSGPDLPDSYAVKGEHLSFFNTPNRRHTILHEGTALVLGKVGMDLQRQADVLVQFSSGITTVTPEDCPCSVRFSLKVDEQEPVVIKRVNIGAVFNTVEGRYQPDRQAADGSFVFSLPAGAHVFSLIAQRIDGDSKHLYAFYQNIQAIRFEQP